MATCGSRAECVCTLATLGGGCIKQPPRFSTVFD